MATSSLSSSSSSALKQNHLRTTLSYFLKQNRCYSKLNHAKASSLSSADFEKVAEDVPTSGICRPLSEILKELNKKVPDSLVKTRVEKDGFHIRYIPWHTVNRVLNLHAPEWSGEVRNITYSADAKSVSVVYRVTLYGTDAEVPGMFVFGDSLVEVGNNNYLSTFAKSNFYPYGIDYNGRPTGRFSNGKSLVDFIGDMLGVPSPPPFLDPTSTGNKLLNGVNYASASGGILDDSGRHYGDRHSMSRQLNNFQSTLNQYKTMMNETALSQFLAKSIVIVVTGSNDYINNYLRPEYYGTSRNYSVPQFGNLLLNTFGRQILALYNMGLRKFFLAGVGPLGCIPNQRAIGFAPLGRCVDSVNQMVGTFNGGLRSMVEQLNRDHSDAMFVYGNTYGVFGDILNNPAAYAFTVIDTACCGLGSNRGQISCLPLLFPCLNRAQHVFWDAFHPTQSATYVFAWRAVNGPQNDAYPINIQQLAQM